jgi:hypothetical protein
VSIGDDQLDSDEPSGLEAAQEGGPKGAVLAVTNVQAQDLAAAVGGHPGGDHHRPGDDPPIDPGLEVGGIQEHIGKGGVGQRAGPEGGHLTIQLGAAPGDLRLGDPSVHTQGLDQVVDLAGGGAVQVGLHDHREQRLIHPPAAFQQRREERPGPQLRDPQLQIPGRGRERLGAVPVALRDPLAGAFVRAGADHRGQLGLDQRLIDRRRGLPDSFFDITTLEHLEYLEQGRLVQSHRVKCPFARTIGVVSLTFTRWPLYTWSSTPSKPPTNTT